MPQIILGSILLATGVIINQRSLAIFSLDGVIVSTTNLVFIWTFQLICIVGGGGIIIFRKRISLDSLSIKIVSWLVYTVIWLVACSVTLFGAFEVFPGLVPKALERSHLYYAMRSRFDYDEELGFRFSPHYQMDMTYFGDMLPPKQFEPEPITFQISHDENGHHNREVPIDPDIAVLGDSWLWMGSDWEDTFAARLEAKSGHVIYNLGVNGYGPHQYLIVFNRYAKVLNPKVALFFLYEGNDITDVGQYMIWKKSGQPLGLIGQVARLSQSGHFERYGIASRLTFTLVKNIVAPKPKPLRGNLVELQLSDSVVRAGFFFRSEPRLPVELLETTEWQELEKVLSEFKRLSQAAGSIPILAFLPSKQHIYAEITTDNSDPSWMAVREQEIAQEAHQEEAFAMLAERLHMKVISLTPAFKARANEGELLYYPFDSHWNSAGRALAADVVAEQLKKIRELQVLHAVMCCQGNRRYRSFGL